MKIFTLTLSPAFDVHCRTEEFAAGRETLMSDVTRDIGGKGINISRALCENGTANHSIVLLGDENAESFLAGMDACGLKDRSVLRTAGRIRENITIHPASGAETRISFTGFTANEALLGQIFELISPDASTLVTFTGSLPNGISESAAESFLADIVNAGARLVIDSKSISLDTMQRLRPWLIKPNSEEIEHYTGIKSPGMTELCGIAKELHENGIGNALISLGADGALLVCREGIFTARPPKIKAVSTIGAGDSMIAGFIAAEGLDAAARLRTAIAYGSAACLREGTNPPLPADIAEILRSAEIERIQ